MTYDDELLVTYGLGYAFEKNKLLLISEIEEQKVPKNKINIIQEIDKVNKFKEELDNKITIKFPRNYLRNVEEVLEEKVSKVIPIITSIKGKNMDKQHGLMDEYIKKDLNQIRLRREGYINKDSNLIKEYLDSCKSNSKELKGKEKSIKYNKMILKIILTTSFGDEFGYFLKNKGQAVDNKKNNNEIEEKLKNLLEENSLVKKKYSELDFLNMLLFLEEWQKKHFTWNKNYTDTMFAIKKNGNKYKGKEFEIKDFVISFIKEKVYLYIPFGKYNKNGIYITLDDEKYCNPSFSKNKYLVLEKEVDNLYKIKHNKLKTINLDRNTELGYILSYKNDIVNISMAIYDFENEKIILDSTEKVSDFKLLMTEELIKHFIE